MEAGPTGGTGILPVGKTLPDSYSLTFPESNTAIQKGVVPVGVIFEDAQDFLHAKLEYGRDKDPASFSQIGEMHNNPSPEVSIIWEWDTSSLSDGEYTLRLTAYDKAVHKSVSSRKVIVGGPVKK